MAYKHPAISLHGRNVGLSYNNELVAVKGLRQGGSGKQIIMPGHPDYVAVFEDFTGLTYDTLHWASLHGSASSAPAIVEGVNGVFSMLSTKTAGTMAADGVQITGPLSWKPNQGELTLVVRAKIDVITAVSWFVGFTDVKTLEAPITSAGSGNTITTNATDGFGLMFDSRMTAANWWLVGVDTDVDATGANLGVAPTAGAYTWLTLECSAEATVTAYVDGVALGKISAAATPTVALTPTVAMFPTSTAAVKTVSLDLINVYASRG